MSNLIGTNPDQVPVNGMLGDLAFQDSDSVKVTDLTVTNRLNLTNASNYNLYASGAGANYLGGSTTISVTDNTNAALRITQLGTGNALVVEDSANPDASPFVINASGQLLRGITATVNVASELDGSQVSVGITNASTGNDAALALLNYSNSTTNARPAYMVLGRSNGAPHTQTAVEEADELGILSFQGSDGTNFIRAASIKSVVDGTPGTNDMPGRLVFSTTADGASSPTERMRIDSAGRVGIGGVGFAGAMLSNQAALTGSVSAFALTNWGTIQAGVTSQANYYHTAASTVASAFTLSSLRHYYATQGTFGAGSAVTSQYGFLAESNLTGATNNYGFYGNLAAATGRYNLYMGGTADNYLAGNVGIGTATLGTYKLDVSGGPARLNNTIIDGLSIEINATGTGNRFAYIDFHGDDTYTDYGLRLLRGNAGANADSSFTHKGTGTFTFTTAEAAPIVFNTTNTERMRIDSSGNVGIGTSSPSSKLDVFGGYISTANTQLAVGNILSTTATLVAGNWYRIATFPATNTGQTADITVRLGNTHNNTIIKVAKGTGQWRAEAYRAGYYVNPAANAGYPAINKVRIYDIGVNNVTHIDIQIAGNTSSLTYNVIVDKNTSDIGINRITLVALTDQGTASAGVEFQAIGTMASWGNNNGQLVTFDESGNVGIGTSSPSYKLQVNGSFAATTKSFVIDHPTKEGMKLRYGSLESPYHGVRLTGEGVLINGTATVKLPDYIHGLCKQEGSQVQITNIKHGKVIWVDDVNVDEDCFVVKSDTLVHDESEYKFYWSFTAIRKDIEEMIVEFAE